MAAHSAKSKPQPVVLAASILAGLTAISGGLAALDILPPAVVGLIVLVVAALNIGVGVYVRGQVVPFADTATYVSNDGTLVAGPASELVTGTAVPVE